MALDSLLPELANSIHPVVRTGRNHPRFAANHPHGTSPNQDDSEQTAWAAEQAPKATAGPHRRTGAPFDRRGCVVTGPLSLPFPVYSSVTLPGYHQIVVVESLDFDHHRGP